MRPPLTPPTYCNWTMSDGYVVRGRTWRPRGTGVQHAIIYLHGIQSHGGWFEWSASVLAENGAGVIAPDRRGSGLNKADRGDVADWRRWLLDIDEIAAWARAEFGMSAFDVAGVSWGGKLAAAWALDNRESVRRLLLIAPGMYPAVDVGLRARFQIGRSMLSGGGKHFAIPLNDAALFTDNPEGRAFIENDPLKLTEATARFFWHSRLLDRQVSRAGRGSAPENTTLLLAERDQIINNAATERWVRRTAGDGCKCVMLKEFEHTLEFAADVSEFEQELRDWEA